jgi:ABC-type Mn2+/Zn2+ transport system ATPase subunit
VSLLELKGVETFYGASQALFGVSLDVKEGEVVALMGRNGMGKTTTINSILGWRSRAPVQSASPAARSPACVHIASPASAWVWFRRDGAAFPT